MQYFQLIPNGDGGWSVYALTKEKLQKWLDEKAKEATGGEDPPEFLSEFTDLDKICGDRFPNIIIRGEVIVPKSVQVTTRYEIQ